ncbi:hypothetical protein [Streptomyces sp. NPDC085540]|uniref:hypothetical protein n=1 Tax=Streptomyces sp. NPDC085540 TaxID=3365730 RepID=UPI0037CEB792
MLTRAAAGLDLRDDVGMTPARYGVRVEARKSDGTGYTLLRLGPYTQTWLASRDTDRLISELEGREGAVVPGFTVPAKSAPFDVNDPGSYGDPYESDAAPLPAAAVAASPGAASHPAWT